jgi:hypothetical protein
MYLEYVTVEYLYNIYIYNILNYIYIYLGKHHKTLVIPPSNQHITIKFASKCQIPSSSVVAPPGESGLVETPRQVTMPGPEPILKAPGLGEGHLAWPELQRGKRYGKNIHI